jgi:hypothetical protein
MKFYRVTLCSKKGQGNYRWYTSRRAAEYERTTWLADDIDGEGHHTIIDEIEVVPTKKGLLAALNLHAYYNDVNVKHYNEQQTAVWFARKKGSST